MRRDHRILWLGSFIVVLAFVLAACGTNPGSTSTGAPSSSPTTTTAGTSGCPGGAAASAASSPANVVLKPSNSNTTVTARVGDVIEIDLPFGQAWTGPTSSQGELQLQTPGGYAMTATKMCVWRFTAQAAGTTQLNFYGKAICKAGQMCPQYIMNLPYTIVIK